MDQSMKVQRSISSGPNRSTEQTCLKIADFVADVLRIREYPDVASARSQFERMFPLLRFLLTTRRVGEPAVTVAMPGLLVEISVSYDPQLNEDLTPPNLMLLDSLTAADLIEITMHSNDEITGRLGQHPAEASTEGIHFKLTYDKSTEVSHDKSTAAEAEIESDQDMPPRADALANDASSPSGAQQDASADLNEYGREPGQPGISSE